LLGAEEVAGLSPVTEREVLEVAELFIIPLMPLLLELNMTLLLGVVVLVELVHMEIIMVVMAVILFLM
jgi:hypothetical protein